MAAMTLILINCNNAQPFIKFIIMNIIAAICWPPPLISQLFLPRPFKAAPFFTACVDITSFCNCKFHGQPMVDLDNSF